ncbi:MAG: methylthioribulose 1-phosphate dehydratase [Candidatus Omnitrophica bacterium]|nr:methylthioribulose 1-phosphate dehydratase [Candidatus Omnitrophota bacterium]
MTGSDPLGPFKGLTLSRARRELARYAALFYARGWMPGTSGNLSLKIASRPLTIVITPSGVDKGELTPHDLLVVTKWGSRWGLAPLGLTQRGQTPSGLRPSAETAIHFALYEAFPTTGAVFHVHTVHSTLVATRHVRHGAVRMRGLEMLKGFETLAPNAPGAIPVLPNIDDLAAFGDHVKRHAARLRHVPGFLIAHHGMSCWGKTGGEAKQHLELMDFLCQYLWEWQRR